MMTGVPFADPTQESDQRPPELQSQSLKTALVDDHRRTEDVTAAQDREHSNAP